MLDFQVLQDVNAKKRKGVPSTPPKGVQPAKRMAGSESAAVCHEITVLICLSGIAHCRSSFTVHSHGRLLTVSCPYLQAEAVWDDYASRGDTPEECLNEKISIKRRDTAANVKEVALGYIKRLRALGWHLHFQCER